MKIIPVKLKKQVDDSYPVIIGHSLFSEAIWKQINILKPSKIAVITDSNLAAHYEPAIKEALKGTEYVLLSYQAGEAHKNIHTLLNLFQELTRRCFDRSSLIIAMGGGVTGDMSGFLASIYLRGIPFIQVPTSLLAMVDSSIGGKTGVDSDAGKNLMGSFKQPAAVIIDVDFLQTLPPEEFANGMAEVIKHAVIQDKPFFQFLEDQFQQIQALDRRALTKMIEWSCRIKAGVVEKDEKERGLRQTLNFGHTIGHAVEKVSDYKIPHGFAVAIGMAAEARISLLKDHLKEADFHRLLNILDRYNLVSYFNHLKELDITQIIKSSYSDKKNKNNLINSVLIQQIGQVFRNNNGYSHPITPEEISEGISGII